MCTEFYLNNIIYYFAGALKSDSYTTVFAMINIVSLLFDMLYQSDIRDKKVKHPVFDAGLVYIVFTESNQNLVILLN